MTLASVGKNTVGTQEVSLSLDFRGYLNETGIRFNPKLTGAGFKEVANPFALDQQKGHDSEGLSYNVNR